MAPFSILYYVAYYNNRVWARTNTNSPCLLQTLPTLNVENDEILDKLSTKEAVNSNPKTLREKIKTVQ